MKEVAVQDGVPNLPDHLLAAERCLPDGTKELLDTRGGTWLEWVGTAKI